MRTPIAALSSLLSLASCVAPVDATCADAQVCGRILYERREPSGELARVPARHLRVTLSSADGVLSSVQLASADAGVFTLPMASESGAALELVVEATLASAVGAPLIHAGEALDGTILETDRSWTWRFPICDGDCPSAIDLGEVTIAEARGSGAAHVFDWVVEAHERVASHESMRAVDPPSLLVLWQDGVEPECGSCYLPTELGGAMAEVDGVSVHFDSAIQLDGAGESPSHWARSTIVHEASHWIMQAYSRWPNDLSVHDPARLTRPGVAYTEGWATFNGQATISAARGELDPLARFATAMVDLERATVNGETIEAPSATGAVDQWVTETTVAAVLWALFVDSGSDPLIAGMRSPRLLELDRGYDRTDLIDLLDALACDGLLTDAEITRAAASFSFPWRAEERLCP